MKCFSCGKEDIQGLLCKECLEIHKKTCRYCKKVFPEGLMKGFDVCPECYDKMLRPCDICGDKHPSFLMTTTMRFGLVCGDCFLERYVECYYCGEMVCYGEECNCRRGFEEYDMKIDVRFIKGERDSDKLYMGFEAEFEIDGREEEDLYTKEEHHLYMIKGDGSLDYGGELVTVPCTLKAFKGEVTTPIWEKIEYLISEGCRSWEHESCGFHVHVNRDFFSLIELLKLDHFIMDNERLIYKIARRGDNPDYAFYNKKSHRYYSDALKSKSTEEIKEDRYRCLNFFNNSTIEFRMFKGTLKKDSILTYLEFVHAVSYFAKEYSYNSMTPERFKQFINRNKYPLLRSYYVRNNL